VLEACYSDTDTIEIGVDEAGRGPMLGRVYTAAVILPKDTFNHSLMKDSKKFHSDKKIREAADYIKKNAIAWCVTYSDEDEVDSVNIRNATLNSMHKSIKGVMSNTNYTSDKYHLLIDGNDFKPIIVMDDDIGILQVLHTCIEGGDNKYSAIAAASILAKVSRDTYIEELCKEHPYLTTYYDLLKNKGYGTAKHMAGIREHGISPFHRKTFGLCKSF
jgi:ribonuclease HII